MSPLYKLSIAPRARRHLAERLPEAVATAAMAFITGPLLENPRRVGKPLRPPMAPKWAARRGEYRIVYEIFDDQVIVEVVTVQHRRDAYRT